MTNHKPTKRTIRRSVGFEGQELEGFFMIANQDAAAAIAKRLTGSQLRLWLYLMMADSFADQTTDGEKVYHKIPSPIEIALKIGASPETVEKDMRVLKKMGFYEHRIATWQGHNLAVSKARKESERLKTAKSGRKPKPSKDSDYLIPSDGLNKPPNGLNNPPEGLNKPPNGLNNPPEGLNNPPNGLNNLSQSLESSPGNASGSPQISQTYSDFKQTLSDSERENFLSFVRKQIKNLPKPVNDLEAWLASKNKAGENRWQVYYNNFLALQSNQTKVTPTSSSLHEEIEQRRAKIRENLAKNGNLA